MTWADNVAKRRSAKGSTEGRASSVIELAERITANEEAKLQALKAEGSAIAAANLTLKAEGWAEHDRIIAKAKAEAEQIRREALAEREVAHDYSDALKVAAREKVAGTQSRRRRG